MIVMKDKKIPFKKHFIEATPFLKWRQISCLWIHFALHLHFFCSQYPLKMEFDEPLYFYDVINFFEQIILKTL